MDEEKRQLLESGVSIGDGIVTSEAKLVILRNGMYDEFGDVEEIHTIVRQGLKEDQADAYNIIDQFNWEPEDMQAVMLAISEGKTPRQSARDWIELNPDKVKEWLD
jgi:ABC-type proline/glycine betaine transport system substrate-binding protein